MPLAVSEEHEALRLTAQRWLQTHCPATEPRSAAESDGTELPGVWEKMATQGWLGLHVPEEYGGQGFDLLELAVVLEELAYALFPGPVLPTVLTSALIARCGTEEQKARLLPGLADGSTPAAVAVHPTAAPGLMVDGTALAGTLRPVLGLPNAKLILAPLADDTWCVLESGAGSTTLPALDGTRPLGAFDAAGCVLNDGARIPGVTTALVHELALVLAAAECSGLARWCLDTASEYAKVRVQFGRPIGQFQAVKHALADMLVAVEQAAAVAWDAALAWSNEEGPGRPVPAAPNDSLGSSSGERALCAHVAGALGLAAASHCAKECIQLLGGIGFTWEHDAHFYLKRAMAQSLLLGEPGHLEQKVAEQAVEGYRRNLSADLPPEAEERRAALRPLVEHVRALAEPDRRAALVELGLIAPHWPQPWGRGADALDQLVLDEEMAAAGITRPHLAVGAWALPTIIAHGTVEQQERWVRPTLLGQIGWCQLFSEPGAGSDLASLSMRAQRIDGGYVLNGQKVWTSLAHIADYGICLARTDPEAPKHSGITYFIVDMHAPGLDIRPLRELTGAAMFNEVFFSDVFVGDDSVIGRPGDGWRIARTTLANERVSMSSGAAFGTGVESLIRTVARQDEHDAVWLGRLGHLLVEAQSISLLGQRATLRALSGVDPGTGSSVRKLLGAEHEQRVQEMGLGLYGADGAVLDGRAQRWEEGFLSTRCLTIAGGTSEVQRNVIAERILGQPKDPEPGS